MSILDKVNRKSKKNTREIMNAKSIKKYGIETYLNNNLVYIIVQPENLKVLSSSIVEQKINKLTIIFKEVEQLEILSLSSRESFEENKKFIKQRLKEEKLEPVRKILQKDLEFFNKIDIQTASAREFLIVLSFKKEKEKEIYLATNRILKLLKDEGFVARKSEKEDIKKMLSVYFVQNLTNVYYEDFNGQSILMNENYF